MKTIIVLPDGETWNTVDGVSLCVIRDEDFYRLCQGDIDACKIVPVVEVGLKDVTPMC